MRLRPKVLRLPVVAAVVGGCAALAVSALGIHPVRITSGSMAPTIEAGDWIVTRDVDDRDRRQIARGDIVMFRFPLGSSGRAIKRVVAVAGDRVAIAARTVTVNGRAIAIAGAPSARAARARVETVPPGAVFLVGDNARASIDSRSFGSVPVGEIVAEKVLALG